MRISEMLNAIASWLESPDNEALLLSEYDENCLSVVASSCVQAAALLKKAADTVDSIEPPEESHITSESLEQLANIATAFDASGDPALKKQASVIDELLLTIAVPQGSFAEKLAASDRRLEDLRSKYEDNKKRSHEVNKIGEVEKAIEKSKMLESPEIHGQSLSTRTCVEHPGAQLQRVGDNEWQCEMDKKKFNYATGFTTSNGDKYPGGDVSLQTQNLNIETNSLFDTRQGRMDSNKA